ncbi:hypothetical protein Tco_0311865, partial [Tanacetum coccineum]
VKRELVISKESVSETNSRVSVEAIDLHISKEVATIRQAFYYGVLQEIWVLDYHFRQIPLSKCDWVNHRGEIIIVNLDSSSDNNNSDSYSTSLISTSKEIDYDSPELPKSLLKWYHYLSDKYKDNGRFWGSKSRCNESDVKPSWKDIEKAKACMLAKVQASEASSKAKVEACGSKAKLQASTKTLIGIVYGPSIQGLLDTYGYDNIEDYLSDFYFPSTDKEDTIVHTGQDPIHKCHSPKSKAKYVPVLKKYNQNVKSPNAITRCVLGLPNVDTWDDILKQFGTRTHGRCAYKWMNGKDYRKDSHHVFCIYSSDDSKGISSKGPSITSIPKEGPSIARLSKEPIPKEFLTWYGYDIVKDDLPVAEKPILKVIFKSPIPIKRCVLGLANVETWDNIVKKYGMRSPRRCADKSKGKRKVLC